ncbi:ATP-dependent RNA helicase DDX3X [Pancytospora philotis]|nr:ATP-dependent RNA helicase DDX3X [Pancytospora philotis]
MEYRSPHMLNAVKTEPPTEAREVNEDGVAVVTNSPYPPLESLAQISCGKNLSFTKPSPVQRHAIPILQHGHPLIVRAPTGMGKTLCFLLPLIESIRYTRMGVKAVVITPTRELAEQIKDEALKVTETRKVAVEAVYGAQHHGSQGRFASDSRSVNYHHKDIIVATPGRLLDLLRRERIKLNNMNTLVLDEADKLLEMGFEREIRAIKEFVPGTARTCLFSATYHKNLSNIINEFLPGVRYSVEITNETVAAIKQQILNVSNKDEKLVEILRGMNTTHLWKAAQGCDKILVFVERKIDARDLELKLRAANFLCESIHGDKMQSERLEILTRFKQGGLPILVATSVAARGIDVKDIKLVVNYDFPKDIKEYIHRIGRTGREGKSGEAISFVDSSMAPDLAAALVDVLQESKNEVPAFLARGGFLSSRSGRGKGGAKDFPRRTTGGGSPSAHKQPSTLADNLSSMGLYNQKLAEKSDSEDDVISEW